ncbi:type I-U CRISPR-associated helicase/endonuclease Cas3 [Pendulispora albinea]|uniref:Type I-U CRISPR-associated helicase/endonuclease Cas3 n=1 Tax=Pendulispora albinea TaxID=2741071 RepID=A0ABZ2MCG3_9BACT
MRLAALLCKTNEWPRMIDLPTGAGKTACIDIALFHLLVSWTHGQFGNAARRIAFVVDRRIIVDEAADRAKHIATSIRNAKDGILRRAADLLAEHSGRAEIDVMTLRGGVARERNLVRDPTAVAVVLSTVDQLGSRLLFRGYGVSDFAAPMHAGMFGFDTLVLLDEAHIAEPFRKTLAGLEREQKRMTEPLGVRALRWSQLSATPSVGPDFSLDEMDERHPVLRRRLQANKPMRLIEVPKRDALPKTFVDLVKVELNAPPQAVGEKPRIGIVVNRVATAREIHSSLLRALEGTADVHLLIGRIRPLDRDTLMADLTPKLKSSQAPRAGELPIVIVATQTIEVGADFDFHTMFVEAASYPAIRQRVGRLNRLGIRDSARGALVLAKADAEDDPVYGATIASTWTLLERAASDGIVDLGIRQAPEATPDTIPSSPATPELSPALVHLLAQTSPRPAIEPDVAQFLHGFVEQAPDVAIVWRDGICDGDKNLDSAKAKQILDVLPPLALEAMSLPLSSFRSLVRAKAAKKPIKLVDAGDLDGDVVADDDDGRTNANVLVLDDDGVNTVPFQQVRPGSMVVIPCEWGGTDRYGFSPGNRDHVRDLSLAARRRGSRAAMLVFTDEIARGWGKDGLGEGDRNELREAARGITRILGDEEDFDGAGVRIALFEWFKVYGPLLRDEVVELAKKLRTRPSVIEALSQAGKDAFGIALRARYPKADDLSDDVIGLQRTVEVPLEEHCLGVAEYAKRFARHVGLASVLVDDLTLAGRLHDLGKADPRFQAMLGADGSRLLAKGRSVDRGVVLGARHECYSVALVDRYPVLMASAHDTGLVRYLIGSHHGRGRGLQPIVDDAGTWFELEVDGHELLFRGRPNLLAVDSGWVELFVRLQRKYGVWGLAYLETILRLADHRRSEAEIEEKKRLEAGRGIENNEEEMRVEEARG